MKRLSPKLLALLASLPGPLCAQDLSYDHADLRYIAATVKDTGLQLDGFSVGGSYSLTPEFQVIGGYSSSARDEVAGNGLENKSYTLGVGVRRPWRAGTDLIASLELLNAKATGTGGQSNFAASDTGYAISAGARMRYLPPLELSATVQHAKIFDEGNTAVGLGAVWSLSPVWSAVAGVGFNSDATSYSAGLRWHLAAPAPAAAVATESSVPELEEPAAVVAADDPPAPPTPPASTAEAIAERPAVISPSAAPAAPAPSPLLGPSATGFYVGAGVKLRGRPTQNGNVLDVIDERAAAEVLASATNADGAWKLVRVGRVSGWIAASELQ